MIASEQEYSNRLFLRLYLYGGAFLLASGLFWWSAQHQATVLADSNAQLQESSNQYSLALSGSVINSSLEATQLAQFGMDYLKKDHLELANIFLAAAATKDPQLRDAAVYAGYTELALAEEWWERDGFEARAHTRSAVTFLEQAKVIDPIYGYTYELLTVAYQNLGETDLANDAASKAQTFAQESGEQSLKFSIPRKS